MFNRLFHLNRGLLIAVQSRIYNQTVPDSLVSVSMKFNPDEQSKILDTINNCTEESISIYLPQSKLRRFLSHKNKYGHFKTLDDLMNIEGFSLKQLEKLCTKILSEEGTIRPPAKKRCKQLLTPALSPGQLIDTSLGLYVNNTGISWAKLQHNRNTLLDWGLNHFEELPKRLTSHDTYSLCKDVAKQLPNAHVYVLEGNNTNGTKSQPLQIYSTQHMEMISMLMVFLNMRPAVSDINEQSNDNYVHFLKARVAAKIFGILVGTESVSTGGVVQRLLDTSNKEMLTLPCTIPTVPDELKLMYMQESSIRRELLGQALLVAVAFHDLCIVKNEASIEAATSSKRTSKLSS